MRIILIRHGLTDDNTTNTLQGHRPVPLNVIGITQAEQLGRRLRREGENFDLLISSDLMRAWQTAEVIGKSCGIKVMPDSAWRERAMGEWEGKTMGELSLWQAAAGTIAPPGAEPSEVFRRRIREALLGLYRRYPPSHRIAVVTHGGPLSVVLSMLESGELPRIGNDLPIPATIANCSIMELIAESETRWSLCRVNDTKHLERITDDDAG